MLTRNPLWPDLLADYLGARLAMPFTWGSHDCCMFAAEWVRICTGEDFAKGYRGKYRSEAGALKLLKRDGGVVGIAKKHLQPVPINFAHRGDLVVYKDPSRKGPAWAINTLGILTGESAAFATPEKLLHVNRAAVMKTAWKVGVA